MSPRYIRVPAERRDTVAALLASGAVAACVGAVTFYFARLLLAREALAPEGAERRVLSPGAGEDRGEEDG